MSVCIVDILYINIICTYFAHNYIDTDKNLAYNYIRKKGDNMANVNVTIRMDEQLKKKADELFSDFGLTLNAAITMFTKQAVREQRIPFEITRRETTIANDDTLSELSKKVIESNISAFKELAK